MNERFERFHKFFFTWHCRNYFNFGQAMSKAERAFIETCFSLAHEEENHDWGEGPHYSYYTYSHRVKGESINSSRLAYGAVAKPEVIVPLAKEIIDERQVEIEPYFFEDDNSKFYLLGWDFEAGHFKVYFRIADLSKLPQQELQELLGKCEHERYDEGLVSFTYVADDEDDSSKLHESKVYVYLKSKNLPPGAYAEAHMITSERGVVPQYDVSEDWRDRLNPTGQHLLDRYEALRQRLDTIAYQDEDNFTIYFPPRAG